jgi:uncharacterized membrane protein
MKMSIRPSQALFAAAMIGLGFIGFIYGNASEIWDPIPKNLPGREGVIYLCSVIELGSGIGLLIARTMRFASSLLLAFLLLWLVLVKLPPLFLAPQVEVNWESLGETLVLSAGGWCLFAAHAGSLAQQHLRFAVGESGVRIARGLLIAALPMIGLSHFVYHDLTASLVPKWLPDPLVWTYLTGTASIVAALGLLFGALPRLAASLEAAMLWLFTLLVWVPHVAVTPHDQGNWSELFISAAIASGALLVAGTYRSTQWLVFGRAKVPAAI